MSVSFSLIRYNEFLSVRDHELAQFAVYTRLQKLLLISHLEQQKAPYLKLGL